MTALGDELHLVVNGNLFLLLRVLQTEQLDDQKLIDEAAIDFEVDDGTGCAIVAGADCELSLAPDFRLSSLDLSAEKVAEVRGRLSRHLAKISRNHALYESVLTADDEAMIRGKCQRTPDQSPQVAAGAYRDPPGRSIVFVVPVGHLRVTVSWKAYALESLIGLSNAQPQGSG